MGKTTLRNNSGSNVQVKEGNSNIFRNLRMLKPGSSMTIQADGSATYREYVLILLPDNKKLRPLSSDEIQELRAIEIFKDKETDEFDWRELPRGAENSWFGAFLDWISSKAGAKADAKADAEADTNAEPSNSRTTGE